MRCLIGNCVAFPIKQQALRVDRTAAEKKFVALRPAAGGESCGAGFYFYRKGQTVGITRWCASTVFFVPDLRAVR